MYDMVGYLLSLLFDVFVIGSAVTIIAAMVVEGLASRGEQVGRESTVAAFRRALFGDGRREPQDRAAA